MNRVVRCLARTMPFHAGSVIGLGLLYSITGPFYRQYPLTVVKVRIGTKPSRSPESLEGPLRVWSGTSHCNNFTQFSKTFKSAFERVGDTGFILSAVQQLGPYFPERPFIGFDYNRGKRQER